MKSLFSSIFCSILLSSTCLSMNQSNSTSDENLHGWNDINQEEIIAAKNMTASEKNKKSGWDFPVASAIRRSFSLKAPEIVITQPNPEPRLFQLLTTNKNIAPEIKTQEITATNLNPIQCIEIKEKVSEQQTIAPVIITITKSPSPDTLLQNNNTIDTIIPDNNNINPQALQAIIQHIEQRKSKNYSPEKLLSKENSDNSSSTFSTQTSSNFDSIESMSIDRSEKIQEIKNQNQNNPTIFDYFNTTCCPCFSKINDLESKKKSSK